MLPCIYCRQLDVPPTREHVLQAAFGATAVLASEVCADCNNDFSAIDKYFIDTAGRYHLGRMQIASLGVGWLRDESAGYLATTVSNKGIASVLPQLVLTASNGWHYCGPERALQGMLDELERPGVAVGEPRVAIDDERMPRCRLIRSAPGRYLLQGRDQTAVEAVRATLLQTGMRPTWRNPSREWRPDPTEQVSFDVPINLNPYCRAMAKVALNFVCFVFGQQVALDPQLDGLRAFARYGSGDFVDFVVPTLLNSTLKDSCAPFFLEQHHGLHFVGIGSHADRQQVVFIALGGVTVGRVDLTRADKDCRSQNGSPESDSTR